MRNLLLLLLLLLSPPLISQELVEFENGQVADADDLNGNLRALKAAIQSLSERVKANELRLQVETGYSEEYGALALDSDRLTFNAVEASAAYTGLSITQGKHYWEVTAKCGPDTRGVGMGVVGANVKQTLLSNSLTANAFFIHSDGARLVGQEMVSLFNDSFSSTQPGDIFLIAIDLDAGSAFFGKNGIWEGNSNPITGENPAFMNLGGRYHAFISGSGRECQPNTFVTNFGASDFAYDVPTGYYKGYCPTYDCEIAE